MVKCLTMVEQPEAMVIHIGVQWDGCTFMLSPLTRAYCELGERRVPTVFLGSDARNPDPLEFAHLEEGDFKRWRIVASMLTGLPEEGHPIVEFRRMPNDVLLIRLGSRGVEAK